MTKRLAGFVFGGLLAAVPAVSAQWDPAAIEKEDTLEFLTVGPEEGEHWSTVWLVVVDGDVYVRLGSRATKRILANTRAPMVQVRVAGQVFPRIRADEVADVKERVAEAMADKYTSDILVRFVPHPLTMRLSPAEE